MSSLRTIVSDTPYTKGASLRSVWNRHHTLPGQAPSLREMKRRHDINDPGMDLVFANTYLMGPTLIEKGPLVQHLAPQLIEEWEHWNNWTIGAAGLVHESPYGKHWIAKTNSGQVPYRAEELGRTLAEMHLARRRPLVAALCETWSGVEATVLKAAQTVEPSATLVSGPGPDEQWRRDGLLPGSGLAVISFGTSTSPSGDMTYQSRGLPNVDIDFFASKGALDVVVQTPYGPLSIIVTHLHSGGDLPPDPALEEVVGTVREPAAGEAEGVRRAQIEELNSFTSLGPARDEPVLMVGDFNTDHVPQYFAAETNLARFADVWDDTRGNGSITIAPKGQSLATIAPCEAADGTVSGTACGPLSVAAEPSPVHAADCRIDHAFRSAPAAGHGFYVDVVRVERLPWRRRPGLHYTDTYDEHVVVANADSLTIHHVDNYSSDDMPYLSDHTGLRLQLRFSPRV